MREKYLVCNQKGELLIFQGNFTRIPYLDVHEVWTAAGHDLGEVVKIDKNLFPWLTFEESKKIGPIQIEDTDIEFLKNYISNQEYMDKYHNINEMYSDEYSYLMDDYID